jgi:peroxiredoxin
MRLPVLALILLSSLCLPLRAAEFATSAESIRLPPAGIAAPDAALRELDGTPTHLSKVLGGKPTVLVFYRGGWCPYCNLQLSELRTLLPDLAGKGFQLVALSPDAPDQLAATLEKTDLGYRLVSDAQGEAMRALGIGFVVDAETRAQYLAYGIDLAGASGADHGALPVPSVFVIDAKGILQFVYANPDYRTRVPERLVRAAVDAVAAQEAGKVLRPE